MNDAQVRQIVRDELSRNQQQARFNLNVNPNVRHTGIDAFPINSANLAPGLKTSGSVTMSSTKTYKFNTNFRPSLIQFFGTVTDNGSLGTSYRSLTWGQAALGQNLYFQTDTKSSVKTGGQLEIVQSCSSLVVNGGGNTTTHYAPIGSSHIIDVWSTNSSSPEARATVTAYGPNFFTVTVNTLASGYSIIGNWFVS